MVFNSWLSCSCEYMDLEYVRAQVIYRVKQVEYSIRVLVVAFQEHMNTYSTRRLGCARGPVSCANQQ